MNQEKTEICYEKRNRMSRLLHDNGFTIHEAVELVNGMRGKSHEEKEQMEEELIEKILSGEVRPTGDTPQRGDDN